MAMFFITGYTAREHILWENPLSDPRGHRSQGGAVPLRYRCRMNATPPGEDLCVVYIYISVCVYLYRYMRVCACNMYGKHVIDIITGIDVHIIGILYDLMEYMEVVVGMFRTN